MRAAVRDFSREIRQGGVGLFYFAGHGVQVDGRNFLIPVGSNIEEEFEVADEGLDAESVLRAMEKADNRLNIIILDACRNNPFARRFRSADRGLARMSAPTGSLVAYATAPGQVAADGDGRNGIFTKHLLNAMQEPGRTLEQVFKQVRIEVEQETVGPPDSMGGVFADRRLLFCTRGNGASSQRSGMNLVDFRRGGAGANDLAGYRRQ